MTANQIIIEPVVTEKSNRLKEKKKYVFRVDMHANKFQIKQALKELFMCIVWNASAYGKIETEAGAL